MSFETATSVMGGPGTWKGELEQGWDILGVTNGGYIMATAARAMEAELDGRSLISAFGSFVNPAGAGPIEIVVDVLKQGRTLSTARATVSMDGKDLVYVTGVYADPDRSVHDAHLVLGSPPELPPPGECVRVEPADEAPFPPPFIGKVDLRIHPEDVASMMGGEPSGTPQVRGWFRLNDGEPLNAHAVVLACDSFPPAIFNAGVRIGWTPTVDLTVQVRRPHPTGWLACRIFSRFITDGMLEEDAEIWDEWGNPVALSRQLALVPR
ncbi:MAG TPA: thioesterase family protein [Acidimicrobiia bacterium]|nr:thioesterase family protein [Acidimicrobiia bacterium]